MSFQALVISQDESAAGDLQTVLADFGLEVQRCTGSEAMARLKADRFAAVVVDFDNPLAPSLLQAVSQDDSGSTAITVALLRDKGQVRSVFGAGANFVLYKPFSAEQAHASLLAAIAMLKRERRRAKRIPAQAPVWVRIQSGPEMEAVLLGISEDGMELVASQPVFPSVSMGFRLLLPGTDVAVEGRGEVAWARPNGQAGIRFLDLSQPVREKLKTWVSGSGDGGDLEEPEALSNCHLTDISLGACYLETASPFPENSGVQLTLKAHGVRLEVSGTVRVTHPGHGMGIQLDSGMEHREQIRGLIEFLSCTPGLSPELLVRPCSRSAEDDEIQRRYAREFADSLLELLCRHHSLSQEEFLARLRQQRNAAPVLP